MLFFLSVIGIYILISSLNAFSTSLTLTKTDLPKAIPQVLIPPCSHIIRLEEAIYPPDYWLFQTYSSPLS